MNKPAFDDDPGASFEPDDDFMNAPVQPWESAEAVVSPPMDDLPDPFAGLDAPAAPRQVLDEPEFHRPPEPSAFQGAAAGELAAPRINIHIFCERPETAEMAEKAAADRRMQKATATIFPDGLAGAVEQYQNQATPSLVIVETQDPPQVLISLLDQLAEVCDPGTKVIVIGRANDIALYRELMKRGVSEYLVGPIQPLQLIHSVTTMFSDPSAPFIGRSIAFIGAKGGVGSSTIAHNFGYSLTEHLKSNAVIVDFDLPFGTAGLDFNQDPLHGVVDALSQPDRLDPVLLDRMMARCSDRLSLFAAPATLDDDYDISPEAFEEVAAKIKSTAPFVILDLPHLWTGWMRRVMLGADDVVIVATPDLASLRNAKNMVDLIRAQRPNDQPPRLVLNQVGVPGRPEIPVKDFGDAIGFPPSLIVPFDPKLFGNASNNGQMIFEVQGKSKIADSLAQFVNLVTRREPPPPVKRSLVGGLFKGK